MNDRPIAIVAPSGPVSRDRFEAGLARLGDRERFRYSERIFARQGFLAGDDDARLSELEQGLADPEIGAVWIARGGYGLSRIIDRLTPEKVRDKPVIGFSDVTVLHAWLSQRGISSIHGPVITHLVDLPEDDARSALDLLAGIPAPPIHGLQTWSGSHAVEGPLFGGNLEVLSRLCGTSTWPRLAGAVLLLEDVGERPYRIDRALTQLERAGGLAGIVGVVLGEFVRCTEPDGAPPDCTTVLRERLLRLGVPLLAGAPIGHGSRNRAVPLGRKVHLDPVRGVLSFL